MAIRNVNMEDKAGKLVITIDPKIAGELSKGGKMTLVATTGGFVPISAGGKVLYLSLNLGQK